MNVACLEPQYFHRILNKTKKIERRIRKRPDSRLDNIQPGEMVIFCEQRSTRNILCAVRGVKTIHRRDGNMQYNIRIELLSLFNAPIRRQQGWHRNSAHTLSAHRIAQDAIHTPNSMSVAASSSSLVTP